MRSTQVFAFTRKAKADRKARFSAAAQKAAAKMAANGTDAYLVWKVRKDRIMAAARADAIDRRGLLAAT